MRPMKRVTSAVKLSRTSSIEKLGIGILLGRLARRRALD
jgi:hypothetical protein